MSHNERASAADAKSPWTRPGFIAAAAIVAIILILGVVIAFSGGSGDERPGRDSRAPAPAASSPTPRGDADASVCGLDAGDQAVPTSAPRATWQLVRRFAAPTAPKSAGPGRIDDGLRSCFAHSPVGALYAAVNVIAMTASDDLRAPFIRQLTVPGVGRDRAIASLGQEPSSAQNASTALQVAGFAIKDYRPRSAAVDLAFRVDSGTSAGYVHLALALRWLAGDWKLALPDTGQPFDGMARISDLTGYVPWRGA